MLAFEAALQQTLEEALAMRRGRPRCDNLRVETAMRTPRAPLVLLLLALAGPAEAAAQPPDLPGEDARERSYLDALRREDAATADRYVALRDARAQAIADLRRAQGRFNAMPPALRAGLIGEMRQAERAYAERSLALLDFLDARDHGAIARYEEEIGRVRRHLEERGATRAELEKLLRGGN